METIKIENKTDRNYRFSSTVEFKPGETTTISKDELEKRPAIKILIDRGDLHVVGSKNKGKKLEANEEIIEA